MSDLESEAVLGQYAQELLDNPVFQDIWTDFENQIVAELKLSSPRDAEGREKCILMMQLLEKLKAMVEQTAETGKMARIQIERKRSLSERAREWISRDGLVESTK